MKRRVDLFAARWASLRRRASLCRRAEEAAAQPSGLHVSDRAGEVDLDLAFEDVEGGRSEIAFAADHLARLDSAV